MDPSKALPVVVERVSLSNMGFVILLKEQESQLVVPIFIGASEAHSISTILHHQVTPRPLSHDLFKDVITTFNGALNHIQVTDVSDNTFYARIIIDKEGQELEFDSRPSDAIALALRFNCPILLNPEVLASSGIEMDDLQEKSEKGKGQLESYRGALKKAITDERYEDAAKLRDQILHLQKHQ